MFVYFENSNDVYPEKFELNKENEDPSRTWLLELSKEAYDITSTTKFFNKRDAFAVPISIVYPIWIAIYQVKCFMPLSILIFYTL